MKKTESSSKRDVSSNVEKQNCKVPDFSFVSAEKEEAWNNLKEACSDDILDLKIINLSILWAHSMETIITTQGKSVADIWLDTACNIGIYPGTINYMFISRLLFDYWKHGDELYREHISFFSQFSIMGIIVH